MHIVNHAATSAEPKNAASLHSQAHPLGASQLSVITYVVPDHLVVTKALGIYCCDKWGADRGQSHISVNDDMTHPLFGHVQVEFT